MALRHFLKAFHISCLFLTKTSINDQLEDTVIKHICNNQPNKGLNSISERIIKFCYNFRTSFALIILNLFCALIGKIDFIDGCNSKQSLFLLIFNCNILKFIITLGIRLDLILLWSGAFKVCFVYILLKINHRNFFAYNFEII